MTNPDWTDRTLPVPERIRALLAELNELKTKTEAHVPYDPTKWEPRPSWSCDSAEMLQLLEDCAVLIQEMDKEHNELFGDHVETLSSCAMDHATDPNGKRWFPEVR